MPENCIAKLVFNWAYQHALQGRRNWVFKCMKYFRGKNCDLLLEVDNMNSYQAISFLEDQIHTEYINKWALEQNRTTAKRGEGRNKLRTKV